MTMGENRVIHYSEWWPVGRNNFCVWLFWVHYARCHRLNHLSGYLCLFNLLVCIHTPPTALLAHSLRWKMKHTKESSVWDHFLHKRNKVKRKLSGATLQFTISISTTLRTSTWEKVWCAHLEAITQLECWLIEDDMLPISAVTKHIEIT